MINACGCAALIASLISSILNNCGFFLLFSCGGVRRVRLRPRDIFLQAGFWISLISSSDPRGGAADSLRRSRTYGNISLQCRRAGAAGAAGAEEDGELNVDLSSAGCGSKEPHWQAEHGIHQSERSCQAPASLR